MNGRCPKRWLRQAASAWTQLQLQLHVMTATPEQPLALPVAQKREFWALMGYAVVLGVFGAS